MKKKTFHKKNCNRSWYKKKVCREEGFRVILLHNRKA